MKKNWKLLLAFFACAAFPLVAEEDEIAYQKEKPAGVKKAPSCGYLQTPPKGPQQPEEEVIQQEPVITPSVAPHVMDGTDTFVTLDFIWWKTFVGGMEYALSGVVDNGAFVTPFGIGTHEGRVAKPDFKFEPGVKAGVGVNFSHDGWDLFAQYTWLSSPSQTSHLHAGDLTGLSSIIDLYYNANTSARRLPLVNASCEWKQDFSVVDLELGRDYFISRYLTLRPFSGLKTGWVNERAEIKYIPTTTALADGINGANLPTSVVAKNNQNMWGLGIRSGANTGWHFTKNWALYGDFAFTALWSDFHISQKQIFTEAVNGQMTTEFSDEKIQTVIPVFEVGLGLGYIAWFDQSRYRFEFRAGWEEQIWVDYTHFMQIGGTGNLTLQGLTLKTALNF